MNFTNPKNNYTMTDGGQLSWLWSLLFGPLYFAVRGNWGWFFISAIMAFITFGISHLFIPFFARKINRTDLLRKGYVEC